MLAAENKALERRFKEKVWDAHDPDAAEEFVDPNVVEHDSLVGEGLGREGFKRVLRMAFSAFPDAELVHEDLIADGDKVAERWTIRGTHRGEFMGIPATNKKVTIRGIDIYRYAGGMRVETWSSFDSLGLMQQLGVVPPRSRTAR